MHTWMSLKINNLMDFKSAKHWKCSNIWISVSSNSYTIITENSRICKMMHNKITLILLRNTMSHATKNCKYALHKTFSVYLLSASRPSGWKSWIVAIMQLCVTNTYTQDKCDKYRTSARISQFQYTEHTPPLHFD